jgi:YHS domain-containing protein
MAYKHTNSKGVTYYLNSKDVTLRGGKVQKIYYFSKDERPEAVNELPEGMTVTENAKNGFLTVKRVK